MEKFSDNYLSYYLDLPKSGNNTALIPVWLTKIIAPKFDRTKPNLFQETVLKLLNVGQTNRVQIAKWIGVDVELIDIIVDTELEPNGWIKIDDNGHVALTNNGKNKIDQENIINSNKEIFYVVQDAITLQFWPRLIRKPEYIDVQEEGNKTYIIRDRESGKRLNPFILQPKQNVKADKLQTKKVLSIINSHSKAFFSQNIRNDDNDHSSRNIKIDDFEIIDAEPEPFYILTEIQKSRNPNHLCQLTDPTGVSKYDQWINELHLKLADKNNAFADKLKRWLNSQYQSSENETMKEFEERIEKETSFKIFLEYPNADKIPELASYLRSIIERKSSIEQSRKEKEIDDLYSQIQKALEGCFKYMLSHWKVEHSRIIPKGARKTELETIVIAKTKDYFDEELIRNFCTVNVNQVQRATRYSVGNVANLNISLKPLIVANLLAVSDHQNHPLIISDNSQLELEQLFEICEERNKGSHYSEKQKKQDVNTALSLTEFTLQWISKYINQL